MGRLAATATSTVPTQVLSDPGSQQVQQGQAKSHSPLALGYISKQIKSDPLGLSGIKKCREAQWKSSRKYKCNSLEKRSEDYRKPLKLAPLIHALYPTLIYGGSK